MASNNSRQSSLDLGDPPSGRSILTSGAQPSQPAAPPSPHVALSRSRGDSALPPSPGSAIKHARTLSYTPRLTNRLSLSFPVATTSVESPRPTPTSSNTSSVPGTPAEIIPPPSPSDPSGFLVALAGQERRVLELKEELQKAEADLEKLKMQWAQHERMRKRAEIRHVEPLQPLQTVVTDDGRTSEEADGATRHSIEMDRRKALLNSTKEPRRKVITGGHTRTLSLLSPDRSNYTRPFPPVKESEAESKDLARSPTMPDTSQGITKITTNRARNSYQGGVTHNARQIAVDVKAGLWTFLEDLRQATVGDEPITGKTSRSSAEPPQNGLNRRGSRSSPLSNERARRAPSPRGVSSTRTWDSLTGSNSVLLDAGGTYYVDTSPRHESKPSTAAKGTSIRPLSPSVDDDDWSNWDLPDPKSPRWSGSTELSEPATPPRSNNDSRNVQ
jgi:hypothetical protein